MNRTTHFFLLMILPLTTIYIPKGALLHVHQDATVNPENFWIKRYSIPCFVFASMSHCSFSTKLPEFRTLPPSIIPLWIMHSMVPLHKACDLDGLLMLSVPPGFDLWMVNIYSGAEKWKKKSRKVWYTRLSDLLHWAALTSRLLSTRAKLWVQK